MNTVLPLGSSILSLVFAAMVFDQWWQRRHAFQLVWSIGLLWYGIAAGCEFLGGAFGWNAAIYRVWYLVGAVLVPAYLGVGTIYLLGKTRFGYLVAAAVAFGGLFSVLAIPKYPGSSVSGYVTLVVALVVAAAIAGATAVRREQQGHVAMAFLLGGTVVEAALVVTAQLKGAYLDPSTHIPVANAIPGYLRVSSFPFNAGGGIALIFGALYSAYIYMPKKRAVAARLGVLAIVPNFFASLPGATSALVRGRLNTRVPATILIAVGASVPGITSSLDRAGVTWPFFLGEFLGVLLIFVGFLVSEEVFRNIRLGTTLWTRTPSLEREAG
jgi:hypothetical protein